jgi:hypothetical protein
VVWAATPARPGSSSTGGWSGLNGAIMALHLAIGCAQTC